MTTRTTTDVTDPKKIWDQLDAEAAGKPAVSPTDHEEPVNEDAAAPAVKADAAPSFDPQLLFDKIAGLEAQLGQTQSRLRNAEGHIGGLNSQIKAAQEAGPKSEARPSADEVRAARASPKAMESLKRDYPDFAEAMESALAEQQDQMRKEIDSLRNSVPAPRQDSVTPQDIERMRAEFQVEVKHNGWRDRVRTPEFAGWLQRQPREVQMLANSDNTGDAIRLLDLHNEATKASSDRNSNKRLESAAALPSGRAGAQMRQKAVEDMSPQEYWRYLDELDKQKVN